MNDKQIFNLCSDLKPETIANADLERRDIPEGLLKSAGIDVMDRVKKERKQRFKKYICRACFGAAAVIAVSALLFGVFYETPAIPAGGVVAVPEYPAETSYFEVRPDTSEELDDLFLESLSNFAFNSSSLVLSAVEQKENTLYSPLSLYMAMALAAESAAGATQEEILYALSMDDIELVRQQTGKLFRNLYTHNEISRLKLANSLWLDHKVEFKEDFLQRVAADYYAHSHRVDFASKEAAESINQWISEQTGGKNVNIEGFDPLHYMSLINTVYFYDEWGTLHTFNPDQTAKDTFYLADGTTVTCDFMNQTAPYDNIIRRDNYKVSSMPFKNSQSMVFILPEEGVPVEDLIRDPLELARAVTALNQADEVLSGDIIYQVPKFEFDTEVELKDVLKTLGMRKAFNINEAQFTNLTDMLLFLSEVKQSVSISIDEKGCEAAAVTMVNGLGDAPPREKYYMILDRPFIFAIIGEEEIPLFIGVINNPLR